MNLYILASLLTMLASAALVIHIGLHLVGVY